MQCDKVKKDQTVITGQSMACSLTEARVHIMLCSNGLHSVQEIGMASE